MNHGFDYPQLEENVWNQCIQAWWIEMKLLLLSLNIHWQFKKLLLTNEQSKYAYFVISNGLLTMNGFFIATFLYVWQMFESLQTILFLVLIWPKHLSTVKVAGMNMSKAKYACRGIRKISFAVRTLSPFLFRPTPWKICNDKILQTFLLQLILWKYYRLNIITVLDK